MKFVQQRAWADSSIGDVFFFLASSAIVDGLLGIPPASSQHACIKFGKLAEAMLPCKTVTACVPGHEDVPSNKIAGRLAKEGSELPAYNQNYASITSVKQCAKTRKK
jgi:hypothetical protein